MGIPFLKGIAFDSISMDLFPIYFWYAGDYSIFLYAFMLIFFGVSIAFLYVRPRDAGEPAAGGNAVSATTPIERQWPSVPQPRGVRTLRAMKGRIRTYLVPAILFCSFCAQAIAEQFPPDHNWTVKMGHGEFGLVGFTRHTYLVCGSAIFNIPLPFFAVVGGVSLLFAVAGIFLWCITSRHHDRKA